MAVLQNMLTKCLDWFDVLFSVTARANRLGGGAGGGSVGRADQGGPLGGGLERERPARERERDRERRERRERRVSPRKRSRSPRRCVLAPRGQARFTPDGVTVFTPE